MTTGSFTRVKKCPICGKARCLVSDDGKIACCWRVIEGSFKIGKNGMGVHALEGADKPTGAPIKRHDDGPVHDHEYWDRWIRLAASRYRGLGPKLGESLGLSESALERLNVGVLDARELVGQMNTSCTGPWAWTFPMYDANRRPIGIRLRTRSGFKYAADGSRNGLFIPRDLPDRVKHLYVVEGPTDTAAALDYGVEVIGRPMNVGLTDLIADAIGKLCPVWLTIVIDEDEPGGKAYQATWRGANELKAAMPQSMDVRITYPPSGKDLRQSLINCKKRAEEPKPWVFR